MDIIQAIKNILTSSKTKILSLGTPPEKEVLYKHVIKRKIPEESSEKLVLQDIKNGLKNIFHQEDVEFSRGTPTPPPKINAKKSTAKKKASVKKAPAKKPVETKKRETKKTTVKSSVSKSTVIKDPTPKKETAKVTPTKTTVTQKAPTAKKTTPAKAKTSAKSSKAEQDSKKTTVTKKAPAKKTVVAKTTPSKTVTNKKAPTTASSETAKVKSTTTPSGTKKAAKIALYTKDITKHYGEVDEDFLAIIVKNLGPSIYRKDAELVSCSDPKELDTVRKNFLTKKLGIDASQGVLDAAIQDVCEELKATRTKYRATFYYALAKKFKKESALS